MNVPECNVCNVPLDEDEHQPRLLGCSHDACTACVKLLIKNGFIECPMCRLVVQVSKAEDLHINHGVVQVLRLFKGFRMSENKPKEEAETANSKVKCGIHEQSVNKKCLTCKVWICAQCTEFHTSDIGCEIQEYMDYLINTKKEHKEEVEPSILALRKNLNSLSTEFSDLEIKKKDIEEQMLKVKQSIEEGTKTLNKFVAATVNVDTANTLMELDKTLNTSNEWHQFSKIWRKKHSKISDSLLEKMKSNQEMYASLNIYRMSSICKLTSEGGNMYLHCFRNVVTNIKKPVKVLSYEQVHKWLPAVRDLVFLDLAIAGQVKGRVIIRLRQDLACYAQNIPLMFTGEEGESLLGLECVKGFESNLCMNVHHITEKINKFSRDDNAGCKVVQGSVVIQWTDNDLEYLAIYNEQGTTHPYDHRHEVIGVVESGLDIVHLCRSHSDQTQVTVENCGIVIEEDMISWTQIH